MHKLYHRANEKGQKEAGGKQRWNADQLFVKVGNEYVSLSDLARNGKAEGEFIPLSNSVGDEMELNGKRQNISDLIRKYRKNDLQPEKGGVDEVAQGGQAVAGAEDNESEVLEKAKKNRKKANRRLKEALNALAQAAESNDDEAEKKAKKNLRKALKKFNSLYGGSDNSSDGDPALKAAIKGMPKINKKNADDDSKDGEGVKDGKENAEEEDDDKKKNGEPDDDEMKDGKENADDDSAEEDGDGKENGKRKNSKRNVEHFLRLNSARETGGTGNNVVIDTMHNRVDRGVGKYGSAKK